MVFFRYTVWILEWVVIWAGDGSKATVKLTVWSNANIDAVRSLVGCCCWLLLLLLLAAAAGCCFSGGRS